MMMQIQEMQELEYQMDSLVMPEFSPMEPELVNDVLAEIQELCLAGVVNRFNELAGKVQYDQEVISFFESRLCDELHCVSLIECKYIYNDCVASFLQDGGIDRNEKFTRRLKALASQIRRITKDLTASERAATAKVVSMFAGGDSPLRIDGGSNFAMATLPEEFLLMLDEHFSQIKFAGAEIIPLRKLIDGQTYTFQDGLEVGECAITAKEELDGDFVVRCVNKRWYATVLIQDLVQVPAAGNQVMLRLSPSAVKHCDQLKTFVGHTGYFTANSLDRDRLVFDGFRFPIQLPKGDVLMAQDLDYKQFRFTELLKSHTRSRSGETLDCVLLIGELVGEQAKPQPVTLSLSKRGGKTT